MWHERRIFAIEPKLCSTKGICAVGGLICVVEGELVSSEVVVSRKRFIYAA